jgi:hypothetical protein
MAAVAAGWVGFRGFRSAVQPVYTVRRALPRGICKAGFRWLFSDPQVEELTQKLQAAEERSKKDRELRQAAERNVEDANKRSIVLVGMVSIC